ncbi:MAG: Amuc_1100 family pilus-like protein [Puniceicoccales bacterium]|jgi:hypothetical protein|nr:Amuc_1100 family pilus-like protein [Puniceicoccales bacterium]
MNLKEYPFLAGILGFFTLIFLAGTGFAAWQQFSYASAKKELQRQERTRDNFLLRQAIAPTEDNLASAKANRTAAETRVGDFLSEIRQKQITSDFRQGATDLVTKLDEDKNSLTRQVLDKGVRLFPAAPADFGFGFSRYIRNKDGLTPTTRLPDLALQSEIIKQLVKTLLDAKVIKEDIIILQAVQREPVEVAATRQVASRQEFKDEYTPTPEEVVRREDALQSYYFRLTFTARTDVLRRYVNMIHNSGYPILLRNVTVSRAKSEVLEPEKNLSAADTPGLQLPTEPAPAVVVSAFVSPAFPPPPVPDASTPFGLPPAEASTSVPPNTAPSNVIIKDLPSEYTIAFEYVIPAAPKEKSGANKPGGAAKPTSN